jgi:HK97 family phage major capsid protein
VTRNPDSEAAARRSIRQAELIRRLTEADVYDLDRLRIDEADPSPGTRDMIDRARRAVDLADFPAARDQAAAQDHIDKLLTSKAGRNWRSSELAKRILATGSPEYREVLDKIFLAAARRVDYPLSRHDQRLIQRAMGAQTGSTGGFAVAFQLDPTIVPSSNLSVNPFRRICRQELITANEWRQAFTSTTMSASYVAEGTQVTDNSPTLGQLPIVTQRAQFFVPISNELAEDEANIGNELAVLIQDAKDDLETTKFTNGNGTNEPFGLLTGATTLVTSSVINQFNLADIYLLEQAIPARFRPRSQVIGNRIQFDNVKKFVATGQAIPWQQNLILDPNDLMAGGLGGTVLGYPAWEDSVMVSTVTTGSKMLAMGDFRYFVIIDRIGLNVEVTTNYVQNVFGTGSGFPLGQKGIYAMWRNGSKVLDANAFRVLVAG